MSLPSKKSCFIRKMPVREMVMQNAGSTLINESVKYGLAFLVMAVTIVGLCFAISAMWRNQNKREQELQGLLKESIRAFEEMKSTINILISKL